MGSPSSGGTLLRGVLFAYFIAINTATGLVAKASAAIEYNVSLTILLVELLKWGVAWAVDFGTSRRPGPGEQGREYDDTRTRISGAPAPFYGASVSWCRWLRYSAPAFLYAIGNNLRIYATVMIGPSLYALLANTRILFAALLGMWLFGQKFTLLQWSGLANLVLACVASRLFKVFACADLGRAGSGHGGAGNGGAGSAAVGGVGAFRRGLWEQAGAGYGGATAIMEGGLDDLASSVAVAPVSQLGVHLLGGTVTDSYDVARFSLSSSDNSRERVLLPRTDFVPSTASSNQSNSKAPRLSLRTLTAALTSTGLEEDIGDEHDSLDFVFVLGVLLVLVCGFISGAHRRCSVLVLLFRMQRGRGRDDDATHAFSRFAEL